MNEDAERKNGMDEAVPPKLDLKKTAPDNGLSADAKSAPDAGGAEEEDAVPTIRMAAAERPRTVLLKKEAIPSKKETSRIPLEAAKPRLVEDETKPKTIRIRPAYSAGVPANGAAPGADAMAEDVAAGKRKTSRIPLEAAIAGGGQGDDASGKPKTIRLKRPGAGAAAPTTAKTVARSAVSLKKTAEIEVPAEGGAALTRRKTVRVKRPVQRPTVRPAAIARPAGGGEQGGAYQPAVEDSPLWIFPTMAVLGVIAALVLVYVQMAQVFGPDVSLTQHSHGWRSLELAWPGKVGREF